MKKRTRSVLYDQPEYSRRMDKHRKDSGMTFRELSRRVRDQLGVVRGSSHATMKLYCSPDAPMNPRPEILKSMAQALGVTTAYLMGKTDDPTGEGNAELLRKRLEIEAGRRREGLVRAFPDYPRLSRSAKAAVDDLVAWAVSLPLKKGEPEPADYDKAARMVGKALLASLKATGLDKSHAGARVHPSTPEDLWTPLLHLYGARLDDFVILTSQALRAVSR